MEISLGITINTKIWHTDYIHGPVKHTGESVRLAWCTRETEVCLQVGIKQKLPMLRRPLYAV